jgi:rsbT co-antagonist protein RsbR
MGLIETFHITQRERTERITFIHLRPEDLALLGELQPLMEKYVDAIVEAFYVELLGHSEPRSFFAEESTLRRVKAGQRAYLLSLFSDELDDAHFELRLRIGQVHERIGLPLKWYVSSMANFFERIVTVIEFQAGLPSERLLTAVLALNKMMNLDLQLALESYASLSARVRSLGQQLQSTTAALNQAVKADKQNDE